jgi:hypothetical protein
MENKMYSNISNEERILLESLGLIKVKKPTNTVIENKVIKGIVKCKLCGTITVQLIKMMRVDGGAWIKQEEIPVSGFIEESLSYEEYNTEVRLCWACRDELMKKDKQELVETIINLYNPSFSRQEIWKMVRKVKEENKHE